MLTSAHAGMSEVLSAYHMELTATATQTTKEKLLAMLLQKSLVLISHQALIHPYITIGEI